MAIKFIKRKTRQELETLYDDFYAQAETILKEFNPCQIKNGKSKITCSDCVRIKLPSSLCCGGCKYLTPTGCGAEKPLGCKIWLCGSAQALYPQAAEKMRSLFTEIKNQLGWGLLIRHDKEENLKNLLNPNGNLSFSRAYMPSPNEWMKPKTT